MRLSQTLAPQVPHRTRMRGAEYAAAGAITSIERHAGIINALVEGNEVYEVFIETAGDRLCAPARVRTSSTGSRSAHTSGRSSSWRKSAPFR